ncbi:hypothetical protein BGX31_002645 [Mortierella sp. GBA43]|nr:hypothetical protein BGX31_002645 [Mortierella sp. GBA43]
MSESRHEVANSTLRHLSSKFISLHEYLKCRLGDEAMQFRDEDSEEYKNLLRSTLVAIDSSEVLDSSPMEPTLSPFPTEPTLSPSDTQDQIVDRAIVKTRAQYGGSPCTNVLAAGYVGVHPPRDIETFGKNSVEQFVRSQSWYTLLSRIGNCAMFYLLTSTSMFAALQHNCFCQITGQPISDQAKTKRSAPALESNVDRKPKKRKKDKSKRPASVLEPDVDRTPKRIKTERKTERKTESKTESKPELPQITFESSKTFYKHFRIDDNSIREFLNTSTHNRSPLTGFRNVSSSEPLSEEEGLLRYMFPKLHGLPNEFDKVKYAKNTDSSSTPKAAPRQKSNRARGRKKPSVWRLRKMRELVKQMLVLHKKCQYNRLLRYYCPVKAIDGCQETRNRCNGAQDESDSAQDNPEGAQDASEDSQNTSEGAQDTFQGARDNLEGVKDCYKRPGTAELLGQVSSFEEVTSYVHAVVKKVIPLAMFGSTENRTVILRATEKRQEIASEFVYWLFNGFLIRLLQEEERKCERMYAKVRLLPKTEDLRPIVNLSRKLRRRQDRQSLESPTAISSSSGMIDLFHRIKMVKKRLVDPSSQEMLFMVKVDIQKAFDNIKQEELFKIIRKSLIDDEYVLTQFEKVVTTKNKLTWSHVQKATGSSYKQEFMEFAYHQSKSMSEAVLIEKPERSFNDQKIERKEKKDKIIDTIETHIKENIIMFGRAFFRQTKGIPQGSCLSPALCRLYYDEIERDSLAELTQSDDSALLRLADDFLFISKSKAKAFSFLKIMSEGIEKYELTVNRNKTTINFTYDSEEEFYKQAQKRETSEIRDTLTVKRVSNPSMFIAPSIISGIMHNCRVIFSDTTHNSWPKVLLNIYQCLIFGAKKFHAYCIELHWDLAATHNITPERLFNIVLEILQGCHAQLKSGPRSAGGYTAKAEFTVYQRHVLWLGANAFCQTLPNIKLYAPLKRTLKLKILDQKFTKESPSNIRLLYSVIRDARNKELDNILSK